MSWYLYALTRAELDPGGLVGLENQPLQQIRAGQVAAAVSLMNADALRGLEGEPLSPDSRLAALATAHDQAVLGLHARGSVLPLRFGTVVEDRRLIQQILKRREGELLTAIEEIEGMVEILCRVQSSASAAEEPTASSRPAATGTAYIAARLREAQIQQDRRLRIDRMLEELDAELREHAGRTYALEPVQPGQLFNSAYLLPSRTLPEFFDAVDSYRAPLTRHGLELVTTGPWPPYHFVHLDLTVGATGARG